MLFSIPLKNRGALTTTIFKFNPPFHLIFNQAHTCTNQAKPQHCDKKVSGNKVRKEKSNTDCNEKIPESRVFSPPVAALSLSKHSASPILYFQYIPYVKIGDSY